MFAQTKHKKLNKIEICLFLLIMQLRHDSDETQPMISMKKRIKNNIKSVPEFYLKVATIQTAASLEWPGSGADCPCLVWRPPPGYRPLSAGQLLPPAPHTPPGYRAPTTRLFSLFQLSPALQSLCSEWPGAAVWRPAGSSWIGAARIFSALGPGSRRSAL